VRVAAAAGALLALLAGVALLVAFGLSDGAEPPQVAPPRGDPVVVAATVEPAQALAGDRVVAELRLTIDTARVDPGSVDVGAFFRPFRRLGESAKRTDLGQTTVLSYRYSLQCLDRACAVGGASRAIELPIGVLQYAPRQGDVVSLPLEWPPVTVESRLPAQVRTDLGSRPQAIGAREGDQAPALVPAGRATAVGWTLIGIASALLLAAAALVALTLRRHRAAEEVAPEREAGDPLSAAIVALDQASGREARRVALDSLALRLDGLSDPALAREARRLAWSAAGPDEREVEVLRRAVERRLEDAA